MIAQTLKLDQNDLEKSQIYDYYLKYFCEKITSKEMLGENVEKMVEDIYNTVEDKNLGCLASVVNYLDSFSEIISQKNAIRDSSQIFKSEMQNPSMQELDPKSMRGSIEKLRIDNETKLVLENKEKVEAEQ